MSIDQFIIEYFYSKDTGSLLKDDNIYSFNYVEGNFFNSIEFVEMIADFEDKFTISFTDKNLSSKEFSTVGGLIRIIKEILASES